MYRTLCRGSRWHVAHIFYEGIKLKWAFLFVRKKTTNHTKTKNISTHDFEREFWRKQADEAEGIL